MHVGQWVGGAIIAVSLIGVACRVWCLAAGTTGFCPLDKTGKKSMLCPFPPSAQSGGSMSPANTDGGKR